MSVRVADDLTEDDGPALGRGWPCNVVVKAHMSNDVYARTRCAIATHEVGHALGLARATFQSTNGAVLDSYTDTWSGEPACLDGKWDGRWVDGHPPTGVMSKTLTIP